MRLTIIPLDGCVMVDGVNKFQPFDLSSCNIPDNIHALQWYDTRGWIEFRDDDNPFTPKDPNEDIFELPEWANNCVKIWNEWTPPVIEEPSLPYPDDGKNYIWDSNTKTWIEVI